MSTNTVTELRAFHGDAKIKAKYLRRVRAHKKADEIRSGFYWENGKGCAVGCTLHSSNHSAYETELGIPRVLAHLEDVLFERQFGYVSGEAAKEWPEKFLSAIKVGADLERVWPAFAHWMLADEKFGLIHLIKNEQVRGIVREAAEFFRRRSIGEEPAAGFLGALREKLWSIYSDALAALDARDALAALDARDALAARDARAEFYAAAAAKLLELLGNAE